ncbi:carboxymuconolactone decarboxylase family protein [Methanocaldococcus infernus]|uniref:Carboxymuconolactone decarboxylase n=1 Tax=Methanocaldococcus infernus (strain DSM 11812 / JCM 15783 / ME) TaxID=573063 RepID=D5VSK2_METIM|nr:carboxymuconolactone decarboxylase family protein [Methanocaldococcus infernus]ADG13555.1 Carboxymuconolactone decarboxylase [Methanocaldococcus infernus ME]
MKNEVFYGEGIKYIKENYKELYDTIVQLNEVAYTGKALDYKTLKLVAIAITAAKCDEKATEKQMRSGMKELGITKDEIMDVLKVVLLTSGMPAFMKAVRILKNL